MTITTTVTMPTTQRPSNMVEWIGLITSAIKELRGEDWFLDNTFTFKEVLTAINNDKAFYTTLTQSIGTKLNSSAYTAADVLAKLKTVDGSGSGLDADLVKGYVPVNKAGDSMTGFLTLHADPTSTMHAATKRYVDEMLQGFSIKKSVRALADTNVALTGLQTIDDVVLAAGDRVLLINQATRAQNGIYDVAAGAWTRSTDADDVANFRNGAAAFVLEGTKYADSGWVLTTDGSITIGTTALEFDKFSGAGQIIPVDGLYKVGNTMGLTDTGVIAGSYTKVTVDAKGRVTLGANPTTVDGYGITDALKLTGGTMSGSITMTSDQAGIIWSRNTDGASIKFYNTSDGDTESRLEFNVMDNATEYFKWSSTSGAVTTEQMRLTPAGALTVRSSVTAPSFVGALTGNASTASKWQTARTVTLTGEVTGNFTIDGSANVSFATELSDTGVAAGTYTKVTVDVDGRVTSATTLIASDIPNLDWSKITTGKPTTLDGYGITDSTYGRRYAAIVKGVTWSRILQMTGSDVTGHSFLLNVSGTRGNVVYNATFMITTSHSAKASIVQLINTNYSNFDIRAVVDTNGSGYIEVYDASQAITNATNQTLNIGIIELRNTPMTPITVFTDGTTIPANHFVQGQITTVSGNYVVANLSGNASSASKLQTTRSISLAGDVTGTVNFDGTTNVTINATYKNSGVTSGTYRSVTVDDRGIVTAASNPTSVDEYGITDAVKKTGDTMTGDLTTPMLTTDMMLANRNKWQREIVSKNMGSSAYIPKLEDYPMVGTTMDLIDNPSGTTASLPLSPTIVDYVLHRFTTWVYVDTATSFSATLSSDDGSAVYINGALIITANTGINGTGTISLQPGWSQVEVLFYEHTGAQFVTLTNFAPYVKYMSAIPQRNMPTGLMVGSVTGNALGNAATATKLQTARTITLTGDVTGTYTFDGTGNVSFATTYRNSGVAAGTYTKVTVDVKGNVTSGTTLVASDIPNLDWSKITTGKPTTVDGFGITDAAYKVHDHPEFVKLDGSRIMTGPLTLAGDPTQPLHATTKQYVDGLIQGIKARTHVDVATTGNITLSASQTIDGITVTTDMRVLVKNQTDPKQNGIYLAKDSAWLRAPEYDDGAEFDGSIFVFVQKGTTMGDTGWVLDTDNPVTLGTTPLNFTQFSRAGVTEGDGTTIVRNGNILSQKSGVVATGTYTKVTVDTYGRVTAGATLSASDIPNLDWTKITSGKPTTLSGYGITDATPSSHMSVVANATTLGHVKIGNGIAAAADGTISADVDGTSIILTGTSPNQKISHADTSTQASITNTNNTVIQSIGVDGYGHVTSISSKTMTYSDVGAVPTTDVVTTATANKILKLDANSKLPASITGNADGNAATASKWQTARTITLAGDATGSVTLDGSANVTLTVAVGDDTHEHIRLKSTDDRDVKPVDTSKYYARMYFTSEEGLNGTAGSNWQDLLVLNSYTDASGGLVNALAFDKSEKKIKHYLAAQDATVWGTAETIAYESYVIAAKEEAINASAPSGHVNVVASTTVLGHVQIGDGIFASSGGVISVDTGDGIMLSGTSPNKKVQANVDGTTIILTGSSPNKQIAHADTSNQASITNTGATVIQSIGVDGMGHVTSMSSKTLTTSDINAVNTSEVVTTPTANKILKLDANAKLPASITGDADTVDGVHANQFVRNDTVNSGEVKFNKGGTTWADPHSGTGYAIKASGGISTDKINIGGKIDLVFNATENSLDIVFI